MVYSTLLDSYLSIWKNRKVKIQNNMFKEAFNKLVRQELLDKLTHPRLRVNIETKFYQAVERIIHSPLSENQKLALIEEFVKIMKEIKESSC